MIQSFELPYTFIVLLSYQAELEVCMRRLVAGLCVTMALAIAAPLFEAPLAAQANSGSSQAPATGTAKKQTTRSGKKSRKHRKSTSKKKKASRKTSKKPSSAR
jgi:hypothetical protein